MSRNPAEEAAALLEEVGRFARRVRRARESARSGSSEDRLLTTWADILEEIRHHVPSLVAASRARPDDQEKLWLLLDDWRRVRPWMPPEED